LYITTIQSLVHWPLIGGCHGRRNQVVGGDIAPHFWDQWGTGGTGSGPVKMIIASTADSLHSVLYK